MQLVRQGLLEHEDSGCFRFYEYNHLKWYLKSEKRMLKQEELYTTLITERPTIDYAIIRLNKSYRNTFYAYSPNMMIIVPPVAVWQVFSKLWLVGQELYMEIATTMEEESDVMYGYECNYSFLEGLYQINSKEMAEAYYDQWQLAVSLKDYSMQRFIRVMEEFKVEIFNYFIVKQMLEGVMDF